MRLSDDASPAKRTRGAVAHFLLPGAASRLLLVYLAQAARAASTPQPGASRRDAEWKHGG